MSLISCSPLKQCFGGNDYSHHIMHMVCHIDQAGSHHHDHNIDGIDNCYCLQKLNPATTVSMVITSTTTMASASKLAIIITLWIASMWVVV